MKGIDERVTQFRPDAVCMTLRNIDSALLGNNEYFLPEIKGFAQRIRMLTDAPLIIGGASLLADARGIADFIEADIAVVGPAEETLPVILEQADALKGSRKIIKGMLPDSLCPQRAVFVNYTPYIRQGGIPGFETHKGCTSSCGYCIEACTPVTFRDPSDVVCELRELSEKGYHHLHLCDPEFNEDVQYCIDLLKSAVNEQLGIRWALYMKPGNYSRQLLRLLKESGAYLITLSVDTFQRCPEYWNDVQTMVFQTKKEGIKLCIDFLAGFPYETNDELKEALDFFRRIRPDEVVVNVNIRVYNNTKIRRIIGQDDSLKRYVTGRNHAQSSFLEPCFYNHVRTDVLKELFDGDPLFRIAGEQKGVNYQRA
jgi:radical SAM superfamily enzyme YgiQ (UPF0313 family)